MRYHPAQPLLIQMDLSSSYQTALSFTGPLAKSYVAGPGQAQIGGQLFLVWIEGTASGPKLTNQLIQLAG